MEGENFHEKDYDKLRVLKIIEHVIGTYRKVPKPKDNYKYRDKFGAAKYTIEGILAMAETVIDYQEQQL